MAFLHIALLVLLHLAVLAGLLAVVIGLSGNFILLGLALLVGWIGNFAELGWKTWFLLLALAVVGEVVEALLGVVAARGFGATRWGMIGTFVGGILGAVAGSAVLPVVGSLLGAFLGAFAGALAGELLRGRRAGESLRAGTGAFLGKLVALSFKLAIGVVIAVFTLRAAYSLI
jgi:uncharacterized protein YqgC (DUF456 family)